MWKVIYKSYTFIVYSSLLAWISYISYCFATNINTTFMIDSFFITGGFCGGVITQRLFFYLDYKATVEKVQDLPIDHLPGEYVPGDEHKLEGIPDKGVIVELPV